MVGRGVTLEKAGSEVNMILNNVVAGQLDPPIGNQVSSAIARGQSFTAVIENAFVIYGDNFKKPASAEIDIKVEYLLEKGQPAIEVPTRFRLVDSPRASVPRTNSFFTKVAGVTFEGRQRIIPRCSVGEQLILVRDPNDHFDKGAIKVMRLNGEQLGFVPADVSRGDHSSGLAFQMDHGVEYKCRISDITGGAGGRSFGVNIEITENQAFDGILSTELTVSTVKAPSLSNVAPVHKRLGWLLFAALAVLLLIVALIMHDWF
jgi:hypothetical protein